MRVDAPYDNQCGHVCSHTSPHLNSRSLRGVRQPPRWLARIAALRSCDLPQCGTERCTSQALRPRPVCCISQRVRRRARSEERKTGRPVLRSSPGSGLRPSKPWLRPLAGTFFWQRERGRPRLPPRTRGAFTNLRCSRSDCLAFAEPGSGIRPAGPHPSR